MRQLITGLAAAAAVMTVSAAPAMACGGGLFQSSCSPCGYVSRCGGGGSYYGSYGYSSYNSGYYGVGYAYQTLPQQQYYYVNQGPVYSGPGNFAPVPTYQEAAVGYPLEYGYTGGPYANPVNYSYGGGYRSAGYGYAPRPAYRPWRPRPVYYGGYRPRPHYYTGYRPRMNYGYGYRPAPRVHYGISQYQHRGYGRPLRRMY